MRAFLRTVVAFSILAFLLVGCASVQNFFCKSTNDEQTQAQTYLNAAQAELATLQAVPTSPTVEAVIAGLQLAIPVLQQVIGGACVAAADLQSAQNAVNNSKVMANTIRKKKGLKLIQ